MNKKLGIYINLTEAEKTKLRILCEEREYSLTEFVRNIIEILWIQRELENNAETGNPVNFSLGGEKYSLDTAELIPLSKEMAQIFGNIDWTKVITKISEKPENKPLNSQRKRFAKAI